MPPSAGPTLAAPPGGGGPPYAVIYADPPWHFRTRSPKGEGRSARRHYPTMEIGEIAALAAEVDRLAAPDSVLLLWATPAMLPQALHTMSVWGFTYKTIGFTWAKLTRGYKHGGSIEDGAWHMGTGYWTRANAEHCLLGTRGRPARVDKGVRSLVCTPVREHSRKPYQVQERIERLLPGPYLELFARERRHGWDVALSDQPYAFKA